MRIVTCDPTRVPAELAGQKITPALIDALPDGVDPCGENGEFHTVVVNMPLFSAPILVNLGDVVTRDGYCYADVIPTA
jgi:diphthamide synthase (EF-2-diphthine--ammonia ligase)